MTEHHNTSPTVAQTVDVDQTPIAWREAGSGDVVLFLHGLGGSRMAWEPQLRFLGRSRRCVAWDMPGYGRSQPGTDPLTFTYLADSAASLLDTLGADRASVVGISMGGMIALHLALRHPNRVTSLVLLDSSPAFGLDGTTDAGEWANLRLEPLAMGRTPADIAPAVLRSVAGPQAPDPVIDEAVAAMARISSSGLAAAVRCLPSHDVRDRLADIPCPTLVAVGDLDTETPPAYSRWLADGIPGARYEEIPGAGHLSNLESPNEVNSLVAGFLSATTLSSD
ncbi:MAG: alpha/beta fold hydrolase [Acidimicrobiia bacterium]|nr:alpha/beta fold hydrolase [Actinomycetota bacterium]MBL6924584.1 alpha/beta fold hydrolase [Acidimicrobiia bacterium]